LGRLSAHNGEDVGSKPTAGIHILYGFIIDPARLYCLTLYIKNTVHHNHVSCVMCLIPRSAGEARRLTPSSIFNSPWVRPDDGYDSFTEDTGSKPVGGNQYTTTGAFTTLLFFTTPLPPFFPLSSSPLYLPPYSDPTGMTPRWWRRSSFFGQASSPLSVSGLVLALRFLPFQCNNPIDIQYCLCISIYS
jgi:hypothetical protein